MTVLTLQYNVMKADGRVRTSMIAGLPSYTIDLLNYEEFTLNQGDSKVINSNSIMMVEVPQPVIAAFTLTNADNTTVAYSTTISGLMVLPFKCSVSLSNPASLGYTIGLNIRTLTD